MDLNRLQPQLPLEKFFQLIPITNTLPDDPATEAVVASYEMKLDQELNVVIGSTKVPLDALQADLRARETNLGDFIADVMRSEVQADVALINGGAIRGDRNYPAGNVTRRDITRMLPFDDIDCKIEVTGATLLAALNNGVSEQTYEDGRFPQVSGVTFSVDRSKPAGGRVSDVRVDGQPLDPNRRYTLATNDYLLDGGNGYRMLTSGRVLISPEVGSMLSSIVQAYIQCHSPIAPALQNRIRILPASP
jgi:5'-nucleotidase/UDP-sugar diphosphatase